MDYYASALNAESNHVAVVVGLHDFTGQTCPKCKEEAAVVDSATAPVAFVGNAWENEGGWIVDVASGGRGTFVAPPVHQLAWSRDGKRLAVLTSSSWFGGVAASPRLEILDAHGRRIGRPVPISEPGGWQRFTWAGDRVVLSAWRDRQVGLAVVDPVSGDVRETDLWRNYWSLGVLRPTDDGTLFVAVGATGDSSAKVQDNQSRAQESVDYTVHRLDVERARIEPEPILRETGRPWAATGRLSPSGRYWLVDRAADRCDTRPLLDLPTGKEIPPQVPRGAVSWLAGDALAWMESDGVETRLLLGSPGEEAKVLRRWRNVDAYLEISPDRKLLFVRAGERSKDRVADDAKCPELRARSFNGLPPEGIVPEARVYEVATGRWIDLPRWKPDGMPGGRFARIWAGPRTLARTGPGFLALEDIDRPGVLRPVIGRASD